MRMTSSLNEVGRYAVFRPSDKELVFYLDSGGKAMKTYLVKQKFRLGGERFDIKDDRGNVDYQVEGSFSRFRRVSPSMMLKDRQLARSAKSF